MAIPATLAPTDPRHYAWWFPGSPVRVHVDLRVIEGLQKQLRDSGPGRAESGLLFGRAGDGATEILEFQPASNRDVREMIAALPADRGKRLLVGYYRTEHGDVLRLNQDDIALFQTFFGKPYQVFLLIQPNAFSPANATFFFSRREQGMSEFPFLEFPLDAALLATEERDRMSRCLQAAETSTPVAIAPAPAPVAGKARKKDQGRLKAVAGILLAALLLAAVWIRSPQVRAWPQRAWSAIWKPQPAAQPAPPPASSHPRIGLQAKRQDRDLELTWDRESPWIAAGTSGLISIEDGSVQRQIPLNAEQIRGESILYTPASDQVRIQLSVVTPTGVATEAIRVIQNSANQSRPVTVLRLPESVSVAPQSRPESPRPAQASRPFTAPAGAKPMPAGPSLTEPPVVSGNPERPSAPAAVAILQPVAPAAPVLRSPPPATAEPLPAPAKAPAALKPSTYHPPVPVTKVTPVFPEQLKPLAVKVTTVAIRVTIDKNGKVIKAEPVSASNIHRFFIGEAVHAAQLWKFQPAQLGGEPIESESILQFTFTK